MKHTPGPWVVETEESAPIRIVRVSDITICTISGHGEDAHADARLIAAAPELLEALKEMHDAFWGTSHNKAEDAANEMARAAIAKAEGKET